MNDDLVSETAAARMLGFDPKTCRKHGFFPPAALVLGGPERVRRLYRRSDIERAVVDLSSQEAVNPLVVVYLNRLSDFLFVAARVQNRREGFPETLASFSQRKSRKSASSS